MSELVYNQIVYSYKGVPPMDLMVIEVPEEFLTTEQAAEILGITPTGVRKLISRGKLPAAKHGRDYKIDPADLVKVKDRKRGYPKGRPRLDQRAEPDNN